MGSDHIDRIELMRGRALRSRMGKCFPWLLLGIATILCLLSFESLAQTLTLENTPAPGELTATPTPTETSEATPSPATAEVLTEALNVRNGPGTEYPVIGGLHGGDRVDVDGQAPNGWLRIPWEDNEDGWGWISGDNEYVSVTGDVPVIPEDELPPTPTPQVEIKPSETPTPAPRAEITPMPLNLYKIFDLSSGIEDSGFRPIDARFRNEYSNFEVIYQEGRGWVIHGFINGPPPEAAKEKGGAHRGYAEFWSTDSTVVEAWAFEYMLNVQTDEKLYSPDFFLELVVIYGIVVDRLVYSPKMDKYIW